MTTRNQALADEIEAINSIYDHETISIVENSVITTTTTTSGSATTGDVDKEKEKQKQEETRTETVLTLPDLPYSFLVSFPQSYPDHPPDVVGTQSTGPSTKIGEGEFVAGLVRDGLLKVFIKGQVCLFDLVEEVVPLVRASVNGDRRPSLSEVGLDDTASDVVGVPAFASTADPAAFDTTSDPTVDLESTTRQLQSLHVQGSTAVKNDRSTTDSQTSHTYQQQQGSPTWIISDPLMINKSTFVARALAINSVDEAKAAMGHLLSTNKKVAGATHNITAWRINVKHRTKQNDNNDFNSSSDGVGGGVTKQAHKHATQQQSRESAEVVIQDCDDDGETAAGGRLLHLMQMTDVWNVMVVVTRWYGGVKLGPDRFKCINSVARDVLVQGGFILNAKGDEGRGGGGGGGQKGKGKKR